MRTSAIDELHELEDLIAAATTAGASDFAGGRLMVAGFHQRRSRLLAEHLGRELVVSSEILDLGLTRAAAQGTGGEIALLARVLAPLQESLSAIAQGITGRPTSRGVIPGTIQDAVALRVAVALPGSLNLRLVPAVAESQTVLVEHANTLLEVSLERLADVILRADDSQEAVFEVVADLGPRAALHLHALAKTLVEGQAAVDLRWRSPRATFDAALTSRNAGALREVLEDVREETRTRKFTGRLVGGNLVRKTFDLQLEEPEGTVISGRVTDDVVGDLELLFGEACTATVEVRESSLRSGETRESFTLIDLSE